MIPKIIHYCWFGGNPMPELALKCIGSWKTNCPGYEIKEWNEENFDLNCCDYVREAYFARKWAFVSDYVRLYALVTEGGIYMDTDVEVLSSLSPYLDDLAFSGFQTETEIPTGIMGCEKGFPLFEALLHDYDNRHFKIGEWEYDTSTNVEAITKSCLARGLKLNDREQIIDGFHLYPHEVFCAKSYKTGIVDVTPNTVTIHHFAGSWKSWELEMGDRIRASFNSKGKMMAQLGRIFAFPFTFVGRCKLEGTIKSIKHYIGKIKI